MEFYKANIAMFEIHKPTPTPKDHYLEPNTDGAAQGAISNTM